ncbi:hypothetical protein SAMN04488135_111116 [Pollutimonas bauzanensis]|uniref:Uncharacterized protein n=1 Tax=Pollutimonas bauzanensis TaxID=658167 RepID=A0A1M5YZP7_9BURK|nr:hypothetical protein SAMN04488135_111116 [Pollutimonas bauzanensis]
MLARGLAGKAAVDRLAGVCGDNEVLMPSPPYNTGPIACIYLKLQYP